MNDDNHINQLFWIWIECSCSKRALTAITRACTVLLIQRFIQLHYFFNIADDEESESDGLSESVDSEDESSNHHLLTSPSGDLAFIKEKTAAIR